MAKPWSDPGSRSTTPATPLSLELLAEALDDLAGG
jgi:hypothetical protein